jgi:hypothetical protein
MILNKVTNILYIFSILLTYKKMLNVLNNKLLIFIIFHYIVYNFLNNYVDD